MTHVTAREKDTATPPKPGLGKASSHSPRTTGPRGGGRHRTSPREQLPKAKPLSSLTGWRPGAGPLSGWGAPAQPRGWCAKPAISCSQGAASPCPLPRQASRACHVPTFTVTKKGDPELGLVTGVPSSHLQQKHIFILQDLVQKAYRLLFLFHGSRSRRQTGSGVLAAAAAAAVAAGAREGAGGAGGDGKSAAGQAYTSTRASPRSPSWRPATGCRMKGSIMNLPGRRLPGPPGETEAGRPRGSWPPLAGSSSRRRRRRDPGARAPLPAVRAGSPGRRAPAPAPLPARPGRPAAAAGRSDPALLDARGSRSLSSAGNARLDGQGGSRSLRSPGCRPAEAPGARRRGDEAG